MISKRKLQVFVSSTYTDLKEERQAAVAAILSTGNIPAGMELFSAGDETQMDVIKRWIDESDVYLLILGGRYGSIEPNSGKSYTHLEYEYAVEKRKALFAVVIEEEYLDEKVRTQGKQVVELDNGNALKQFRTLVCSNMVSFFGDLKDIKLAIQESMSDFMRREELKGWIPGDQQVSGVVAEEIAKLTKENQELRERISLVKPQEQLYNGLSFSELFEMLLSETIAVDKIIVARGVEVLLNRVKGKFGHENISFLHLFFAIGDGEIGDNQMVSVHSSIKKLESKYRLVHSSLMSGGTCVLTDPGHTFYLQLVSYLQKKK
jgi:Domain of unknown function (DUF4062)